MNDRDKVVDAFRNCITEPKCKDCPWEKEQEAVKPRTENDGAPEDIACWWYVCGNCGCIIDPGDDYCRHCGRAVKWDANGEE